MDETKKTQSQYWPIHLELIRVLDSIGFKVHPKDRLPLFKLWRLADAALKNVQPETRDRIKELIAASVKLRCEGLEPEHKGNRYAIGT